MTMKVASPPPVPFDLFEAVVSALVVAISEAGMASCHGERDREILAERFERAAEGSLPESPHREPMKSLLRAAAGVVRNAGSRSPGVSLK